MFLILVVVAIAFLFLLPKKGGKFPSMSAPLPQRDADRKEALDLIEAKLVEADKQSRFNDAVTVISGLAESKKAAK